MTHDARPLRRRARLIVALNGALVVTTATAAVLVGGDLRSSALIGGLLGLVVVNRAALLWAIDGEDA